MALVVVLGAGVIGLTTALELKRSNAKLDITIVADHLPGDIDHTYTSPFAGPIGIHLQLLKINVYRRLINRVTKVLQLAAADPRSGIWAVDNLSMYTDYEVTSNNGNYRKFVPWFKDFVDGFEIVDKLKLPEGIAFAHKFKGVVISVYTYLNYLVQQNKEIGNVIKRIPQIHHIEDARKFHSSGKKADYVINAAGLNASKIKGVEDKSSISCAGPSFACQKQC